MKLAHDDINSEQIIYNYNGLITYTKEYPRPVTTGPVFTPLGMVHVCSEQRFTSYFMVLDSRRYRYYHEHHDGEVNRSNRALSARAWKFAKLVTEIVTGEPVD
jgi:hypothetical protein